MSKMYELGSKFTWENPEQPNQRGWALSKEIMSAITDGTITKLVLVLDAPTLQTDGGLGGIEVILNSKNNGFGIDFNAFPWCWNMDTQKGGYTSYIDMLIDGDGKYAELDSNLFNLTYDLTKHKSYAGFRSDMSSAEWGEVSIQYGIGIRYLPLVNAYLK